MTNGASTAAFRFYVVRELAIGPDGNWTMPVSNPGIQAELANAAWSNLVKPFPLDAQALPQRRHGPPRSDELAAETAKIVAEVRGHLGQNQLQGRVANHLGRSSTAPTNTWIQTAPFRLAKDPAQAERLDEVLYNLVETCRILAIFAFAFHPRNQFKDLCAIRLLDAPNKFIVRQDGAV